MSMSLPRASIRSILFVVLIIAADLAALRVLVGGTAPFRLVIGIFGILPISNLLAIAAYRNLSRHAPSRPFFLGFSASGILAIVIYSAACLATDQEQIMSLIIRSARTVESTSAVKQVGSMIANGGTRLDFHHAIKLCAFAGLTTLPQIIMALLGGWIARRFPGIVGIPEAWTNSSMAARS